MHLEKLENGTYLAIDKDGTKWVCKRKPFDNGLGRWFVHLMDWSENYEDYMQKMQ